MQRHMSFCLLTEYKKWTIRMVIARNLSLRLKPRGIEKKLFHYCRLSVAVSTICACAQKLYSMRLFKI